MAQSAGLQTAGDSSCVSVISGGATIYRKHVVKCHLPIQSSNKISFFERPWYSAFYFDETNIGTFVLVDVQ